MIQATTMTPTTPAPPNGVSSPRTRRAPAPISVRLAVQAWNQPGFIPRLSNHRPVPAIFPPPKMWLTPWAMKTAPMATRKTRRARSTAWTLAIGWGLHLLGADRERPARRSDAGHGNHSTLCHPFGHRCSGRADRAGGKAGRFGSVRSREGLGRLDLEGLLRRGTARRRRAWCRGPRRCLRHRCSACRGGWCRSAPGRSRGRRPPGRPGPPPPHPHRPGRGRRCP